MSTQTDNAIIKNKRFDISLNTLIYSLIGLFSFILILLIIVQSFLEEKSFYHVIISDVKNFFIACIVGLVFSLLLSLNWIRDELLTIFSRFISSSGYIDKLTFEEKKKLKEDITKRLHTADIVSNKESLFNFLEKFDIFLSKPHQSITVQNFIFRNLPGRDDLFISHREDDYRIHTLNLKLYNTFDIEQKIVSTISRGDIALFIKNFSFSLNVLNGQGDSHSFVIRPKSEIPTEIDLKKMDSYWEIENKNEYIYDINVDYLEEKNVLLCTCKIPIELVSEYTRVNIKTSRIANIDNFFSVRVLHPTYGHYCTITFPEDYEIKEVSHHQNLNLIEKQTTVTKDKNHTNISTSGWQFPGMAFALSYKKCSE